MSFKTLPLKGIYRTATDSLVRDFYLPFLACATQYDRAVGFFSSSMLIEAAYGLSGLIKNKGRMRLLIGYPLSDEDWEAVRNGLTLSRIHEQLRKDLALMLERAGTDRSVHSFELLSWMVATRSIEIRFAFRKGGMYHEKIGVLTDADENRLVFHGSANESANALLPTRNFESLAVYPSWRAEIFAEYGTPFQEGFLSLWDNRTPEVFSVGVPSDFYESLLRFRKDKHLPPDLDYEAALHVDLPSPVRELALPRLPAKWSGHDYALREHQQHAIRRWHAHSYNGIFALATGAGKTITALHAATRIASQTPIVLVIAVPYQVLAEQWVEVMGRFGMLPIRAFYSRERWKGALDQALCAFRAGAAPFVSVVVVNDTLASPAFQSCLDLIPAGNLFFVGDECHHHSGPEWLQRIPLAAKFKLGMSATPWNPGRTEHKAVLEQLYGPVVAQYGLKEALEDHVLCPYDYYWVPCEFDEEEAEEYERISSNIASLIGEDPQRTNPRVQTALRSLFARRTRLLGALRDKNRQLDRLLQPGSTIRPHTLFYCGEGAHPVESKERVVDATVEHLSGLGWKVARITAAESVSERARLLLCFDEGMVDAVAAMRVLDEGFDIPSCRTAYLLASSLSYRQYVQRRGRVLRQAPGKDFATIYDFVALPSRVMLERSRSVWRQQVATELTRVRSFVDLARNSARQQFQINERMQTLGLAGIYYEELPISEEDLYGD